MAPNRWRDLDEKQSHNRASRQSPHVSKWGSGERRNNGSDMTTDETEKFKAIVIMANRVAREFNDGDLDTCILTSYALASALTDLGYANARPVRVEAASFPDDHKLHAVSLGRPSGRRAPKGYWCGHLAVCIGQSWLLDPTLDQSNDAHGTQWADAGIGVEPVAASLAPEFWESRSVASAVGAFLCRVHAL